MKHFTWLILISVGFFLALTWHWPKSDAHFLWNLEPYPDGLFYVVPAWNLIEQGRFIFSYDNLVAVKPSVLPVYSLMLAVGYLIVPEPQAFYWVNVGLGGVAILALLYTLRELRVSGVAQVVGIGTYLAHGLIVWLPAVPMAENAGLTLMCLGILGITKLRSGSSWQWALLTTLTCLALGFTKYTFALPAVMLMLFLIWRLCLVKAWKVLLSVVILSWLGLGLYVWYQLMIGFNPLNVIHNLGVESQVVAQTTFYSLEYLGKNMSLYFQILVGKETQFLWLKTFFTHGLLVLGAVAGFWLHFKEKEHQLWTLSLVLAFLAQFPVLLIFYIVDARYLILSVPIIAIGVGLLVAASSRRTWLVLGSLMGVLIVFTAQQSPLWKSIVSSNWFNRSEAWQYRAIQVIDNTIPEESYIITVLPPHLFEIYSQKEYQVLPLSFDQEFLEKNQIVWPALTTPNSLLEEYRQKLMSGSSVYASRSYLSAESSFTSAWQDLENNFTLVPIKEGCYQTCTIYQVLLPKESS